MPPQKRRPRSQTPKNKLDTEAEPFTFSQTSHPKFPRPSVFQSAQLKGIPCRPSDVVFIFKALTSVAWSLIRLHVIELPYLIATRFKNPTRQHHPSWFWALSIVMAVARSAALQAHSIASVRLVGEVLMMALTSTMILRRHVKVTEASFKVKLDVLLGPERATLSQTRKQLAKHLPNGKLDPVNPPDIYFDSFHPLPSTNPRVANLPEEVGHIDDDGCYTLRGEWIEVLDDPKTPRPRSKIVCLYFHGSGHTFLSPRSHRSWVARLMQKFGPGARAFVVDYRQAPEHPFPAAIHDAFAAYLYLTKPDHAAIVLTEDSCQNELAVEPNDIFVAGDSAGGNLTVAFNLYMKNYVMPSARYEVPFASVAISPWSDMGSTLPSTNAVDWHCYCPGPIGSSPFDKQAFVDYKINNKHFPINLARNYLCGDATLVPNQRNGFGDEHAWKWYTALAQHPLTSIGHRGNLDGLPDYLFHTASYDRLVDDARLLAHRVGLANPDRIVRLELYKDTVHVHHMLEHLEMTTYATNNIVRFILRVMHARQERRRALDSTAMETDENKDSVKRQDKVDGAIQITSNNGMVDSQAKDGHEEVYTSDAYPEDQRLPLAPLLLPSMMKEKGDDHVEWVVVEKGGREKARNEGWPVTVLKNCWPLEG